MSVREFLDTKAYQPITVLFRCKIDNMPDRIDIPENRIRFYVTKLLPNTLKEEAAGLLEKLNHYKSFE